MSDDPKYSTCKAKPIHLIVGADPNDVKLMCGGIDLTKNTFIESIHLDLKQNHKKLVIEFCEFTAEIEATPTDVIKASGVVLPKWLPADAPVFLAD